MKQSRPNEGQRRHDGAYGRNLDIGGYMQSVAASGDLSAAIRSSALAIGQTLSAAVVADTRVAGASGLSVLLPESSGAATAADYTGASYQFLSDTRWGQFIAGVNASV